MKYGYSVHTEILVALNELGYHTDFSIKMIASDRYEVKISKYGRWEYLGIWDSIKKTFID